MGEIREGLGEMADPAVLVTALVQVGLLKRAFTGTELAAETDRAGGTELFRLEMAHALAGAADMHILMAAGAAADAGPNPPGSCAPRTSPTGVAAPSSAKTTISITAR
jgi:hypothetical protein